MKRPLQALLSLTLVALALATVLTVPASADPHRVTVQLPDGSLQQVVLDVPPGATLQSVSSLVSGVPVRIEPLAAPAPPPKPAPAPNPSPPPAPEAPQTAGGEAQPKQGAPSREPRKPRKVKRRSKAKPRHRVEPKGKRRRARRRTTQPRPAAPSPAAGPGFTDALPGPSRSTGVPDFVIRKFRVPIFLLPIYQAAGIQYGIRWEVLAAINEIETDYGRNLNVSSAGAQGWMQFMPATWRMYGTDANKDGKKDPYNPVDAIFAAARYLKAAGGSRDIRRAIFAYNHAGWYVDSVTLRARLISGVPEDLVGSLTGLTEGRFPIAARARYSDAPTPRHTERRGIEIFARNRSPVVATADGVVRKIGRSRRLGRYVIVQDVYGNSFTYGRLGSVARLYPVPKEDAGDPRLSVRAMSAGRDPRPLAPASAGRQRSVRRQARGGTGRPRRNGHVKRRLFANPGVPGARENGGLDQMLEMGIPTGSRTHGDYLPPIGADTKGMRLRRLRRGAKVIAGTVLGRVGGRGRSSHGRAAKLRFEIRPAGRGAPRIDPKPILDGWKLLEATAIHRASGRNVLKGGGFTIGQILMMPKRQLQRRVLADPRIEIYPCGRADVRTGQIDRRALATLAYLAESGLRPSVSSLKCGHGLYTASGNVSHHSSGNALDISKVNGIPILGHQERGGITDQTVRRLMGLQGGMRPSQIISLLDLGANTVAMGDHADHIHLGFRPRFGDQRLSRQTLALLKPDQWDRLLKRLRRIENPVVPTRPSRAALPAHPRKLRPVRELSRR